MARESSRVFRIFVSNLKFHKGIICTVALGNAAVFLLCLFWPIPGDLAAFPVKVDQRTARRPKGP